MKTIIIKNFKCFNDINIPLNGLTIFTGANGNGKSSAIQALLLLRRTIEHCAKWNGEGKRYIYDPSDVNQHLNVELNGAYCLALGTSNQILPVNSSVDKINIGITQGRNKLLVTYSIGMGDDLWITPQKVKNNIEPDNPIFFQEFYYLNAERWGPRANQPVKFYDYQNVGWQGEYSAQLLGDTNFTQRFKIEKGRRETSKLESPKIEQQVNAWINYIFPNTFIEAAFDIKNLSAQIRIGNKYSQGLSVMSPNIGFGISYVLPIIITGLIARKNSFMIIENPEAHLHPSAQSKIGKFLATIANAGINIIIETHSDHVLNGIQVATAKKQIKSRLVTINFFDQEENKDQPNLKSISLTSKGELSHWPKGFFDQTQMDFAELYKARHG